MNSVEQLYDNDPQREWAREARHRMEFAVTRRALADYLQSPPATIVDLGGGPGKYAIPLTQLGYSVTLVDLSQGNLALAQVKAAEVGVEMAAVIHADILSLPTLPEEKYDAVLLKGRCIICWRQRNGKRPLPLPSTSSNPAALSLLPLLPALRLFGS